MGRPRTPQVAPTGPQAGQKGGPGPAPTVPNELVSAAPVNHPGAAPPVAPVAPPVAPVAPPVQPISFNGGAYNPTTAPFGWDQSQPGQVEQMWGNNQSLWLQDPNLDWVDTQVGKFEDPWAGEQQVSDIMGTIANPGAGQQYWNGAQGTFNKMGNNAQTAFDMTKGMLPGSLQPGFDKYYDRMKEKSVSDVNSQSAARGAYGSSAGLNGSIGAALDVEAQRAKANTDFMLADSANQRDWQGVLGNQGRAADLSAFNKMDLGGKLAFQAEGMDFDKQKAQADLAFGMDDQALERLGAGVSTAFGSSDRHRDQLNDAFDAAGQADAARNTRINTLYGQIGDFGNDVLGFVTDNYDAILSGDQANVDQQIESWLAETAQQQGWDERQIERVRRDTKDAIDIVKKFQESQVPGG